MGNVKNLPGFLFPILHFGIIPFIVWIIFGYILYWIIYIMLSSFDISFSIYYAIKNTVAYLLVGLGFIISYALTHSDASSRKILGFAIGFYLPIFSVILNYFQYYWLLFFIGLLLGYIIVKKSNKFFSYILTLALFSPIVYILYTQIYDFFGFLMISQYIGRPIDFNELGKRLISIISYLSVLILNLYLIRDGFKPSKLLEENLIPILGPKSSGKTILSIGLFYCISNKKLGKYLDTPIAVNTEHINLYSIYLKFLENGYKKIEGTKYGEVILHKFLIFSDPLKRILWGFKDKKIEIVDYAGEYLGDISKLSYDDRFLLKYCEEIRENLKKYNLDEYLIDKIINNIRKRKFRFEEYLDKLDFSKLNMSQIIPLYIAFSIYHSNKIIFLIDGIALVRYLYKTNPTFVRRIEQIKSKNKTFYNFITRLVKKSDDNDLNRLTLVIDQYKKIKDKFKDKDIKFLITKSDFILYLYGLSFNNTKNLDIICNEIRRELSEDPLLECVVNEGFFVSMVISKKDIDEIYGKEESRYIKDQILVGGLDKFIEYIKKDNILSSIKW